MTYVDNKQLLFREAGDAGFPVIAKRSEGRMKTYPSATDARSWCDEEEERRQYILEIIRADIQRCGVGRYVPLEVIIDTLLAEKNREIEQYKRRLGITGGPLTDDQKQRMTADKGAAAQADVRDKSAAASIGPGTPASVQADQPVPRRTLATGESTTASDKTVATDDVSATGTAAADEAVPAAVDQTAPAAAAPVSSTDETGAAAVDKSAAAAAGVSGAAAAGVSGAAAADVSGAVAVDVSGAAGAEVTAGAAVGVKAAPPAEAKAAAAAGVTVTTTGEARGAAAAGVSVRTGPELTAPSAPGVSEPAAAGVAAAPPPGASPEEMKKITDDAVGHLELMQDVVDERDELSKKLKKSEDQMECLKQALAGGSVCAEEIEALEKEIQKMKDSELSPEEEIELMYKQFQALTKYCEKLSCLEKQNECLTKENEKLEEKLSDAESCKFQVDQLISQNSCLKTRICELTAKLEARQLSPKVEELIKQRDCCKKRYELLNCQFMECVEDKEWFKCLVHQLEEELHECEEARKCVESERDQLKACLAKFAEVWSHHEEIVRENGCLKSKVCQLEKELISCGSIETSEKLKQYEEVLRERNCLRVRVCHMEKERATCRGSPEQDIHTYCAQLLERVKCHEEIVSERNCLKAKVSKLETELMCYRKLPEQVKEFEDKCQKLQEVQTERDDVQAKLSKLRQMEEELCLVKKEGSKAENLEKELERCQNELKIIQCESKKTQVQLATSQCVIENLKAERDLLRMKVGCTCGEDTDEVEALKKERDCLREKVDELAEIEYEYLQLLDKMHCFEMIKAERDTYKVKYEEMLGLECELDLLRAQVEKAKCLEQERDVLLRQVRECECCVADQEDEIGKLVSHVERLSRGTTEEQGRMQMSLECLWEELKEKNGIISASEEQLCTLEDELRATIDQLTQEKNTLNTTIDQLSQEKNCLQTRIWDLEDKLEENQQEMDDLRNKIRGMQEELKEMDQLKAQIAECSEKLQEMQQLQAKLCELERKTEEMELLKAQIMELTDKLEAKEARIESLIKRAECCKNAYNRLKHDLSLYTDSCKCAYDKVRELSMQEEDCQCTFKELQNELLKKEEELKNLQCEISIKEDLCSKLKCQIEQKDDAINSIKVFLTQKDQMCKAIHKKLKHEVCALANENEKLRRATTVVADASGDLHLMELMRKSKNTIERIKDELNVQYFQWDKLMKKQDEYADKLMHLEEENSQLKASLDETSSQLTRLQCENEFLRIISEREDAVAVSLKCLEEENAKFEEDAKSTE